MQDLNVTIIQSDLHWANPESNIKMFDNKIDSIKSNTTDIIILPEMFNTGFITDSVKQAEEMYGKSFEWMKKKASEKDCIISGSLFIKDGTDYLNRFIWMQPDGKFYYYDKNHLFSFAGEHKRLTAGKNKIIIEFKGWRIFPVICYDLRFPVWCKNNYSEEKGFDYDLMIVVASWPEARSHPWKTLLMARAIENVCYVAGVNRVGTDGYDLKYSGDSAFIDQKGNHISDIEPSENIIETTKLSRKDLFDFRNTFRVCDDWDKFKIIQ